MDSLFPLAADSYWAQIIDKVIVWKFNIMTITLKW